MRRVIVGHQQVDSAVGRPDVKLITLPARTSEHDVHAAIGGIALDVAANSDQVDSAVGGFELNLSMNINNRDAAVAG